MSDPTHQPRTLPWWAESGATSEWWNTPALTSADGTPTGDDVVLVDATGRPTGIASRTTVHDVDTPLHLAFSCWVTREDGHVLLTRRALTKRTWPGVWTNSFCGHPRPGESYAEAVHRHAAHELGTTVSALTPAIPGFRYRAVDFSGVVENEICPVFTAVLDGDPLPNPDEVMDLRWVPPQEIADVVRTAPWAISPWMVEQVQQLGSVPVTGALR